MAGLPLSAPTPPPPPPLPPPNLPLPPPLHLPLRPLPTSSTPPTGPPPGPPYPPPPPASPSTTSPISPPSPSAPASSSSAAPSSMPAPSPSIAPAVFSLDLSPPPPAPAWLRRSPMLHPRAGFACAAVAGDEANIVAGGGSRHHLFGADGGSRLAAAEMYDAGRDRWAAVEGMPAMRAGCAGFMLGMGEFWVVGGYGDCRTISGVFPVDEYYRDGVILDLEGGGWKETGEMWVEVQWWRLESVVSIDDSEGPARPGIFMLDGDNIFRFDIENNHWFKESTLPRKTPPISSSGFVALGGELYVMFALPHSRDSGEYRKAKHKVRLFFQTCCPKSRKWRLMMTKTPFWSLNFKTAVMCTIKV